ncbi:MAG: hypothetical protein AAGJ28_19035 [Pseudomonadota bacterium]
MSLEYLLLFGLGLAVVTALAVMSTDIVDFVRTQVDAIMGP